MDLQAGSERSVAAPTAYPAEPLALGLTIRRALTVLRSAGAPWDDLARDTAALSRSVLRDRGIVAVIPQPSD